MAATSPVITRSLVEGIVRDVVRDKLTKNGSGPAQVPVHASARHMHVSREDLDILYGPGYELTVDRPLYQEGNFAARETVALVGPRNRMISNLRILGPLRKDSQIELAFTDAIGLGFDDIPVRISGDIEGTPGAVVMGPKGVVQLKKGLIRAAIHVHMGPDDAKRYGVKHRDIMRLRIGGEAGVTFDRVHVRIDPTSKLVVHMDTDEANACGLHLAKQFELIR